MAIGPIGILLLNVAQDAATVGGVLAVRGASKYFGDWRDHYYGAKPEPTTEALRIEFEEKRNAGLITKAGIVLDIATKCPDALTLIPPAEDGKDEKLLPGIYGMLKKAQWRKQQKEAP